jgi:hypothetical protein
MSRRALRRLLLVALSVVLAVATGRHIYAYWTGSGSGTGSGGAATTQLLTLSPATPSSSLYPGGAANVVLTVSNPNAFPVHIGSFVLDTGGIAVTGHAGCDVATLTFTPQNPVDGWTVPANGPLSVTLANALAMGVDAANECQGATFTVYLRVGP